LFGNENIALIAVSAAHCGPPITLRTSAAIQVGPFWVRLANGQGGANPLNHRPLRRPQQPPSQPGHHYALNCRCQNAGACQPLKRQTSQMDALRVCLAGAQSSIGSARRLGGARRRCSTPQASTMRTTTAAGLHKQQRASSHNGKRVIATAVWQQQRQPYKHTQAAGQQQLGTGRASKQARTGSRGRQSQGSVLRAAPKDMFHGGQRFGRGCIGRCSLFSIGIGILL
jgi:hypothetical protein